MYIEEGQENLALLEADSSDNIKSDSDISQWGDLFPSEIYSPLFDNTPSETCFYGPIKFVGLKPKKLVIADDGLAFYMEGNEIFFNNVNRIVTVDLESFAIETAESNIDAKFNVDIDSDYLNKINIYGNYYDGDLYSDYTETVYGRYIGIKNAD